MRWAVGLAACAGLELLLCHLVVAVATFALANCFFAALAEAETTLARRLAYAKYFAALTSGRRARRLHLPHFSLKKVLHIKAWLALRNGRGWLKRYRRQRVADTVVTLTFYSFIAALVFVVTEFFRSDGEKGSDDDDTTAPKEGL